MGAFFTNIHFKCDQPQFLDLRQHILEIMHRKGFRQTQRDDPGSRNLIVAFDSRKSFGVIFANWFEDQDESITEFSADVSCFLTSCFSVLNHDDDVAQIALFENGRLRDGYNSDPESWPTGNEDIDKISVNPKAWSHWTSEGLQLKKLVSEPDKFVFSSEIIEDFCKFMRISSPLSTLGYRYLIDENIELMEKDSQFEWFRLGFEVDPDFVVEATGEPVLRVGYLENSAKLDISKEKELMCTIRNFAGRGKGLIVVIEKTDGFLPLSVEIMGRIQPVQQTGDDLDLWCEFSDIEIFPEVTANSEQKRTKFIEKRKSTLKAEQPCIGGKGEALPIHIRLRGGPAPVETTLKVYAYSLVPEAKKYIPFELPIIVGNIKSQGPDRIPRD